MLIHWNICSSLNTGGWHDCYRKHSTCLCLLHSIGPHWSRPRMLHSLYLVIEILSWITRSLQQHQRLTEEGFLKGKRRRKYPVLNEKSMYMLKYCLSFFVSMEIQHKQRWNSLEIIYMYLHTVNNYKKNYNKIRCFHINRAAHYTSKKTVLYGPLLLFFHVSYRHVTMGKI